MIRDNGKLEIYLVSINHVVDVKDIALFTEMKLILRNNALPFSVGYIVT